MKHEKKVLLSRPFFCKRWDLCGQLVDRMEEMFFPPRCIICSGLFICGEEGMFCADCFDKFDRLKDSLCRICGEPLMMGGICEQCLRTPPPYGFCRSLFAYNDMMRQLVLQFKFRRDRLFLAGIAQLCDGADLARFADVDIVAPVPLHLFRLRARGFNQSLLLCRLLFGGNKDVKIVPKLLERIKNTTAQSSLSREERLENLKEMFVFCGDESLCGKHICLVDDVITTGATIDECCKTLLKSIDCRISVLSLARTLR